MLLIIVSVLLALLIALIIIISVVRSKPAKPTSQNYITNQDEQLTHRKNAPNNYVYQDEKTHKKNNANAYVYQDEMTHRKNNVYTPANQNEQTTHKKNGGYNNLGVDTTAQIGSQGVLRVLTGSSTGMQASLRDRDVIIVGKDSPGANFVLSHGYEKISRIHCEIQYDAVYNCYYVTDKSSNGTYIGDNHLRLGKEQKITVPRNTRLILADDDCILALS